jgi:ubiquinone/menaquinone biosynthesis C-methylase UbiE
MKPSERRVNYDQVAPVYDQRYAAGGPQGIASALLGLARNLGAKRILEVGCGTGHWLAALQPVVHQVYGLDLSFAMLQKAHERKETFYLVRGHAQALPFADRAFDLIFGVNALHHFDHPQAFMRDSGRLLRKGGVLVIIGMDPHAGRDCWYLYDYFAGTYEADLSRYPSAGTVVDWMIAAGFDRVERRVAARIVHTWVGRKVLSDPTLQKNGTSQLVLLTHEAYAAGMARIEAALTRAEATAESLTFPMDVSLTMVTGYV